MSRSKAVFIELDSDRRNTYEFVCEGCGSEGNLGIPADEHGPFGCPEGCGATYIQWVQPNGTPTLTCVVCPIFDEHTPAEPPDGGAASNQKREASDV